MPGPGRAGGVVMREPLLFEPLDRRVGYAYPHPMSPCRTVAPRLAAARSIAVARTLRTGGRATLLTPGEDELRSRSRHVPARVLYDEVQPEDAQQVASLEGFTQSILAGPGYRARCPWKCCTNLPHPCPVSRDGLGTVQPSGSPRCMSA